MDVYIMNLVGDGLSNESHAATGGAVEEDPLEGPHICLYIYTYMSAYTCKYIDGDIYKPRSRWPWQRASCRIRRGRREGSP